MCRSRRLRFVHRVEDKLERVSVKSSRRMNGQRCWLVHHEDRFIFMQQLNIGVHIGLDRRCIQMKVTITSTQNLVRRNRLTIDVQKPLLLAGALPSLTRLIVPQDTTKKIQQASPLVSGRNVERAVVIVGFASRQRFHHPTDCLVSHGQQLPHLLFRSLETIWTRLPVNVARVTLIVRRKRRLTRKTLHAFRFLKARIHTHALIENETLSVVVCAPALLEVLQNSAVQLEDVLKAFTFHERSRFLAANSTRAKHDDGLVFHFRRKLANRLWEFAEIVATDGHVALKGSLLHFIVAPRIEPLHPPAFIQPLFQRLSRQFWRSSFPGPDSGK